jgi:adenylosuccinate synthase
VNHVIVVDLGYGDAGKGTVVDWLCASRPVHAVVRFNGGAQAAHTVVLPDGRSHTFAQFGAGTLRGVRTHLSRFVVVDPLALPREAAHLAALGVPDPLALLTIDADAPLATPYHRAANRARELARDRARHGSCGMGVGETMAYLLAHPDDAPYVRDCRRPDLLRHKLSLLRRRLTAEVGRLAAPPVAACVEALTAFAAAVSIVDAESTADLLRAGTVVFEGAQGVLLDEWHGFHPYTTWSTTTFANAERLLTEAGQPGAATRLGVVRTFTTRHGPGPLVTEDTSLGITDPHNPTNPWQGPFRVGHFDAVAHRYAVDVAGGVDALALTHLDLAGPRLRMCRSYDWTDRLTPAPLADLDRQAALTERLLTTVPVYGPAPAQWVTAVETALDAPVVVTSHGPTAADKRVVADGSVLGPHPAECRGDRLPDAPAEQRRDDAATRPRRLAGRPGRDR